MTDSLIQDIGTPYEYSFVDSRIWYTNILNSMQKGLVTLKATIPSSQGIIGSNIQSSCSNKLSKYPGYFNVLELKLLLPDWFIHLKIAQKSHLITGLNFYLGKQWHDIYKASYCYRRTRFWVRRLEFWQQSLHY